MAITSSSRPPAPGGCLAKICKFLKGWLGIILSYVLHPSNLYREVCIKPKTFDEMPNRTGEVVVLTGGTKGIGLQVLKKLLQARFHVILGCRSLVAGEEVISSIRDSGVGTGSWKVFELDLKSLKSVRRFAENVLQTAPRIDLLINNAGVMFSPYELTEDGYETQFQTNYLSHFLLTNALLPRIKETSRRSDKAVACRIVNVSSNANYGGDLDFEDLEKCKVYSSSKSYNDSKLSQVIHARYLDKVLAQSKEEDVKVNVYSLHPGVIPTDLWNSIPQPILGLANLIKFLFRTTEDGADTVIYTALSPELEGVGGVYISSCQIVTPNSQAGNVALQLQLWERSLQLVK